MEPIASSLVRRVMDIVDPQIATQVYQNGIPNYSLVIVANDGTVFSRMYTGDGKIITPEPGREPLQAIGSQSKSFTCAAIFKLAEEKKIDLNDPFLKHLPALNIDANSPLHHVTILQLMRHQSTLAAVWPRFEYDKMSATEMLEGLENGRHNAIGKGAGIFDYSNLGIALLGQIIEHVSAIPYANYVHQKILQPNGLHDIFPSADLMSDKNRKRLLKGHHLDDKGDLVEVMKEDCDALNASTGYVASATGMARFYHALLTGKILSAEHTEMLHESHIPFGKSEDHYAYAPGVQHIWLSQGNARDKFIGHHGFGSGCAAMTGIHPELGVTISLMNNAPKLPSTRSHAYNGIAFPNLTGLSVLRILKNVRDEAKQSRGFLNAVGIHEVVAPMRVTYLPRGFNPEANNFQ